MIEARLFWASLTAAALLASRGPKAVLTFDVDTACHEVIARSHIMAAPAPQSEVARREFLQPEFPHIEQEPLVLQEPPGLPIFVPPDDSSQAVALLMRHRRYQPNLAAIIASTGSIEPPIVPPGDARTRVPL